MSVNETVGQVTGVFERYVDAVFKSAEHIANYTAYKLLLFIEEIARPLYVALIVVGILLYSTHISRRTGKDLVKGGIIIAVLAELIPKLVSFLHASP